jgi:hypothetical protein
MPIGHREGASPCLFRRPPIACTAHRAMRASLFGSNVSPAPRRLSLAGHGSSRPRRNSLPTRHRAKCPGTSSSHLPNFEPLQPGGPYSRPPLDRVRPTASPSPREARVTALDRPAATLLTLASRNRPPGPYWLAALVESAVRQLSLTPSGRRASIGAPLSSFEAGEP